MPMRKLSKPRCKRFVMNSRDIITRMLRPRRRNISLNNAVGSFTVGSGWHTPLKKSRLIFADPDHEEMFMGHRPRNEAVKRAATYCTGCIIEEQSMDLCPWNVLTSCPIWHHEKYNVRFGEEGLSECPQCRAENCERS